MMALGLIETVGLTGVIEAADAMLKAADVHLLERAQTDGLVTVTVAGEVSAVQASVQAAKGTIQRIAGVKLLSAHVIPRPDEQLERIIRIDPGSDNPDLPPSPAPKPGPLPAPEKKGDAKKDSPAASSTASAQSASDAAEPASAANADAGTEKKAEGETRDEDEPGNGAEAPAVPAFPAAEPESRPVDWSQSQNVLQSSFNEALLKSMTVAQLRAAAEEMKLELKGRDIRSAGKKALIAALLNASAPRED